MAELRAQPGSPGGRGHPTLKAEQIPSCGGENGDGGSRVREMLSGSSEDAGRAHKTRNGLQEPDEASSPLGPPGMRAPLPTPWS